MKGLIRFLCCTLFLLLCWWAAITAYANYINNYSLDEEKKADAIVVLTGGGHRIEYALDLLANKRGKALFISGVGKDVPLNVLIRAAVKAREASNLMMLGEITLGREATNTISNAEETNAWITDNNYKSVLLVTADYHMPRALIEFQEKLPKDVKLVPAAVKTGEYGGIAWMSEPVKRNLILREFHKLIAAKTRHLIISGLKQ